MIWLILSLLLTSVNSYQLVWKSEGHDCARHSDCFYYKNLPWRTDRKDSIRKRGIRNKLTLFGDIPLNEHSMYCDCMNKCARLIDYPETNDLEDGEKPRSYWIAKQDKRDVMSKILQGGFDSYFGPEGGAWGSNKITYNG